MKRLLNVRKDPVTHAAIDIEVRLEGKIYKWGPGEAMDVTDQVASWMIRKLNDLHHNDARPTDAAGRVADLGPWVEVIETDLASESDAARNIVRAQIPAGGKVAKKAAEIDPALVEEALAAIDENKALKAELEKLKARQSKPAKAKPEPVATTPEPELGVTEVVSAAETAK